MLLWSPASADDDDGVAKLEREEEEDKLFQPIALPSFDWMLFIRTPFDMIRRRVKIMAFIIKYFLARFHTFGMMMTRLALSYANGLLKPTTRR